MLNSLETKTLCLFLSVAVIMSIGATNIRAQSAEKKSRQIIGTVIQQKKYSIAVSSYDGYLGVAVPATTPVRQLLERPQFDEDQRSIKMELLASAVDGDPANNFRLDVALPEPLYISSWFAHRSEYERLWNGNKKMLVRYCLTGTPQSPQSPASATDTLRGRIAKVVAKDQVDIELEDKTISFRLGDREASIDGYTILDLRPHETEVELQADWIDGEWVAQSIHFRRIVDRLSVERAGLPRVLNIGDETSLAFHRFLCQALKATFNVYHPPENCRGSENFLRAGCWIGDFQANERKWNVVVFNCGLADFEKTKSEYQSNLEKWVEVLQPTSARLIWVPTINTDKNNAKQQEAVDHLNAWALEILEKKSDVEILSLPAADHSPQAIAASIADKLKRSRD